MRVMRVMRLIVAVAALALAGSSEETASAALPTPITTVSGQQFHDSLGVNVKETYWNTIYGNWRRTLADVVGIGFTRLRVGIFDSSNAGWNARHWGDLKTAVASGLKLNVDVGPDCSYRGTPADPHFTDCFNALRHGVGLGGVESIEWPNEYDISGDANWAANLAGWGHQIYLLTKTLGPIPVYGPSIVNPGSVPVLGDQSAFLDAGNFHDYRAATSATPQSVAAERSRMQPVSGSKRDVATEFGYHNQLSPTDPGAQPGIDERGAAIYVIRQYVEHLADGLSRSYVNQLYDLNSRSTNSNDRFGLIRSDGSYKPAALALKNFISMIGRGAPAKLTPLYWGIRPGDASGDVRYLDIEPADGGHDLVLWRTASVWDRAAKVDLAVNPVPIHIQGISGTWKVGDPMHGASLLPGSGAPVIPLGADPIVLQIPPPTPPAGSATPQSSGGQSSGPPTAAPNGQGIQPDRLLGTRHVSWRTCARLHGAPRARCRALSRYRKDLRRCAHLRRGRRKACRRNASHRYKVRLRQIAG
jgi:hypothetical protein